MCQCLNSLVSSESLSQLFKMLSFPSSKSCPIAKPVPQHLRSSLLDSFCGSKSLFQPTNWIQSPPKISPNQSHGGLARLPLWNPTANPYQNTHKPQNRHYWVRQRRPVSRQNLRQPGPHRPRPLSLGQLRHRRKARRFLLQRPARSLRGTPRSGDAMHLDPFDKIRARIDPVSETAA